MSLSVERRTLLKMLGLGTAAAMPVFRVGRLSAAPTTVVPQRLLCALMFNGVQQQGFWPVTTATDVPLSSLTLPKTLEPLEPFKSKMLIVRGLTNAACISPGGSHTRGHTGFSGFMKDTDERPPIGAVTIDQHVANVVGTTTKFKSLQFATKQLPGYGSMFTAGNGGLPPMQDPKAAFDRVFGMFTAPSDTAPTPPANTAELEALRLEQKSVFDHITKDLTAVSAQLGGSDRQRMDAHLTAIREIEQRLGGSNGTTAPGGGAGASCQKPMPVTYQAPDCQFKSPYDPRNDPACKDSDQPITTISLDIIAAAFACDLTRVASFQWGGTASGETYSWVLPGNTVGHHDISHYSDSDAAGQDKLMKINRWHQEVLAAFYAKLQTFSQPDGQTLLDHSVSYFTSEIGKGNSHQLTDMPVLLVGGGGGALKTGRYVKITDRNQNDLLISLANVFGSTVTTYGTESLCKGPLTELT
jgi:hypothetical protein